MNFEQIATTPDYAQDLEPDRFVRIYRVNKEEGEALSHDMVLDTAREQLARTQCCCVRDCCGHWFTVAVSVFSCGDEYRVEVIDLTNR